MKIIFTRHGESLANTLHIISNRDLPHPLTEIGRSQAAELAVKLMQRSELNFKPVIRGIYSSPVVRARETAEIVGAALNLAVNINQGLTEYDCGILEGRGDVDAWQEHNRFFHDWLEGRRRENAPAGGETFTQIRARMANFVDYLRQEYGQESEVLCVSHGGTLRLAMPGLLENLDFDFVQTHGLGHTEMIQAETRSGKLVCSFWGEHQF